MATRRTARRARLLGPPLVMLCVVILSLGLPPASRAAMPAPGATYLPLVARPARPRLAFYASGECARYSINPDGSGLTMLFGPESPTPYASLWSPDGQRLAILDLFYVVGGRLYGGLWVLDAATRARTRLGDDSLSISDAAWAPDSERLVFSAQPATTQPTAADLYLIRADGSGLTKLTDDASRDVYAAWSPDGRRIAFVSIPEPISMFDVPALTLINVDGSGRRVLASPTAGTRPVWSPDGRWIAFLSSISETPLSVIRPDGGGLTRLATRIGIDWTSGPSISWAPDGRRMVAQQHTPDGSSMLVVLSIDDQASRVLTAEPKYSGVQNEPAWSPGGDLIAFMWYDKDDYVITLIGADGMGLRDLVRGAQPVWLH